MARRGRTINTKGWTGLFSAGQSVITTTQAVILEIGLAEASIRETLLRSRGEVCISAIPDAATDSDVLAIGLIVVHSNAATAGGVSVPGPIKDMGADWLWHFFIPMDASGLTGQDASAILLNRNIEIDSKAMRRVPPDHSVILVGEAASGDFATVNMSAGMRLLFGH